MKLKNQNGQTMIEILLALVVISVVFISIALLSSKSVQLSSVALNRQTAIYLAKQGVESIRKARNTQTWTDFASSVEGESSESIYKNKTNFTRQTTVVSIDNQKYEITITVSWEDVKGRHSLEQKTFVSKW